MAFQIRCGPSRFSFLPTAAILILVLAAVLPLGQGFPVAAQSTGIHSVFAFECTSGYDPGNGDANSAFSNCTTVVPGASFTLQSGDPSYSGRTLQTDLNGWTSWTDVPLLSGFSVSQTLPAGQSDPWVYCEISGNANDLGNTIYDFFPAPGGVMDIGFTAAWLVGYSQSACYWFNSPNSDTGGSDAGGSVTVHAFACPEGTDWQTTGYELLLGACPNAHPGVSLDLLSGSYASTQVSDGSGSATWSDAPFGTLQLVAYPPSGYQVGRMFCNLSSPDVASLPSWEEAFWSDGYFVDFPEGWSLECYVFDVLAGQQEVGTISVEKRICGPSLSLDDLDDFEYLEVLACPSRQPNIEFELVSGAFSQTRTTDASGYAVWENVPEADYSVIEDTSPWRMLSVYCGYSESPDVPLEEFEEYGPDEVNQFSVSVPIGYYVHCIVFDMGPQSGLLWIVSLVCPPGTSAESAIGCEDYEDIAGIQYEVSRQTADGQYVSLSTTDEYGQAFLADPPGGVPLTIRQVSPEFEPVYAQCAMAHYGEYGYGTEVPYPLASDGSFSGPWIEQDTYTHCVIYSVPVEAEGVGVVERPQEATLVLQQQTCPEGYDLYDPNADVAVDCVVLAPDVEFALTSASSENAQSDSQTTGDDGVVTWSDIDAGPYVISESLPEGVHAAFIGSCQSDARSFPVDGPFSPIAWAGPNGQIGITLLEGETLSCLGYNIPSAPTTVSMLAFDCPAPTVIIAQCSPAGEGFAFALNPAGGEIGAITQFTTDENGVATASVAPGVYSFAEQGADPCLIDSASIDDQGQLVVDDQTTVEVRIYHCGT